MTAQPPVRSRTRPASATVAPPSVWPNGSELRDSKTGNLLGWTVRLPNGQYQVFRSTPIYIGTAKDAAEAHALLTK